MIDYALIFVTGMLTSLHCVGMCGAIVLAYSVPGAMDAAGNPRPLALHTAYNAGRILAYAALGGLVGALGMTLSGYERFAGYVSIAGGAVMIIAAFAMLGLLPLPTTLSFGGKLPVIAKLHASLIRNRSVESKFTLGFLTPLLPCGLLYAMLAKAATSGSTMKGLLAMAIFGLGMAPSLLLLGSVASFFTARVRKGAEVLASCAIMLMGAILILRGMHIPFLGFIPTGSTAAGSCCRQ